MGVTALKQRPRLALRQRRGWNGQSSRGRRLDANTNKWRTVAVKSCAGGCLLQDMRRLDRFYQKPVHLGSQHLLLLPQLP